MSVIGGECSGKTTLSRELAQVLPGVYVPESLREFVDRECRTPTKDEQQSIMHAQIAAELAAAAAARASGAQWVVSDPGGLMTAVYSVAYFNDDSLLAEAIEHQRDYALTVLCDIDFPWQADGDQRDGPKIRRSVHDILRRVIREAQLPVAVVGGPLPDRVRQVVELVGAFGGHR